MSPAVMVVGRIIGKAALLGIFVVAATLMGSPAIPVSRPSVSPND